jgi:hypothetical protein
MTYRVILPLTALGATLLLSACVPLHRDAMVWEQPLFGRSAYGDPVVVGEQRHVVYQRMRYQPRVYVQPVAVMPVNYGYEQRVVTDSDGRPLVQAYDNGWNGYRWN